MSNTVQEQDVFQEFTNLEEQKMFNELTLKITHQEIEQAIRNLKSGKAVGHDNFISKIIAVSKDNYGAYLRPTHHEQEN